MTLDAHDRLCAWTLTLGDADFVHQHVVDAHMLQHATPETKPIGIAFALAGLCLHLHHGYTGRAVQEAHMKMGRAGGPWPVFALPEQRGDVTAADVVAVPTGPERVAAIDGWCEAVWKPWSGQRGDVEAFLRSYRVIP